MRKTTNRFSSTFKSGKVSPGQLVVAGVLLIGLLVLSYGYFQQNTVGFYMGLLLIVAGVLNGVVLLVTGSNK